jgi:hypothetical protein
MFGDWRARMSLIVTSDAVTTFCLDNGEVIMLSIASRPRQCSCNQIAAMLINRDGKSRCLDCDRDYVLGRSSGTSTRSDNHAGPGLLENCNGEGRMQREDKAGRKAFRDGPPEIYFRKPELQRQRVRARRRVTTSKMRHAATPQAGWFRLPRWIWPFHQTPVGGRA